MKINRKQYTFHGFERASERLTIRKKELYNLSLFAVRNGLNFGEIPPGPLKSYVGCKASQKNKRIKLYRGYVFVFFLNSRRLITCYPIPEKHFSEYKELMAKKKAKKNVK